MNKTFPGALVALLAIGGIALTLSGCSTPDASAQVIASNGSYNYETFTQDRFDQLLGSEAFTVFVHSKTCGTCAKKEKQIIDEISQLSTTILKMSWDGAPTDFLAKYGIAKYDTFITFDTTGNANTVKGAQVEDVRGSVNNVKSATPSIVAKVVDAVVPRVLAASGEFTYEEFSMARYNELVGNEKFAVFFHSKTCGTCAKKHKQAMDEISQFSAGTLLRAEFGDIQTEYPELLQRLGVAKYDTMVVFNTDGTFETLKGGTVEDVRNAI